MKENPLKWLIGKQVMVIGTNVYKGTKGTIRDMTPVGDASMFLHIFNEKSPCIFNIQKLCLVWVLSTCLAFFFMAEHFSGTAIHCYLSRMMRKPEYPSLKHHRPLQCLPLLCLLRMNKLAMRMPGIPTVLLPFQTWKSCIGWATRLSVG